MSDLKEVSISSTKIIALKDGELNLPKEVLLNVNDQIKNLEDETTKI